MAGNSKINRDLSWLSFNERVLQEASDISVPLRERIKFLGIYSNNTDEFFRVRVASLIRMLKLKENSNVRLDFDPNTVLTEIQHRLAAMQSRFDKIWNRIRREMVKKDVYLVNEKNLTEDQKEFVLNYFNNEVRNFMVPLMLQNMVNFPVLSDKALYLACKLSSGDKKSKDAYALVSVPTRDIPRFLQLPKKGKKQYIILLEDVIRLAIPNIFSFFDYDKFNAHIIKLTRDAEFDIDSDLSTTLIQKIEKGIKGRKKGKTVRFIYDKDIESDLLEFLVRKLNLSGRDQITAGGRIHNFRDFMDFPDVFEKPVRKDRPVTHPAFVKQSSISKVIFSRDVILHTPYHSFDSIIDMLREAAINPAVTEIKLICYRLANKSKIINTLINAHQNGKKVTVMMELRARFDEEANLRWKSDLEEAGIRVLIGFPKMKVHAKLCLIKQRGKYSTISYGFIGTGNLNEKTAKEYCDHYLLTSNRNIMADANRIFDYLEKPTPSYIQLKRCKTLIVSPVSMRKYFITLINNEIKQAQKNKEAGIVIKMNSLSDKMMIDKLSQAAEAGVKIRLIIRGIFCMRTERKKFKGRVLATSIIDEKLEHGRVMAFHNRGNPKVFISSADWMTRNLDYRIETACPIKDKDIRQELLKLLDIQMHDNVKARILDDRMMNTYARIPGQPKWRSQPEIKNYLSRKSVKMVKE